jgi:hypothetical protein
LCGGGGEGGRTLDSSSIDLTSLHASPALRAMSSAAVATETARSDGASLTTLDRVVTESPPPSSSPSSTSYLHNVGGWVVGGGCVGG